MFIVFHLLTAVAGACALYQLFMKWSLRGAAGRRAASALANYGSASSLSASKLARAATASPPQSGRRHHAEPRRLRRRQSYRELREAHAVQPEGRAARQSRTGRVVRRVPRGAND
jgi:hypothetical protein